MMTYKIGNTVKALYFNKQIMGTLVCKDCNVYWLKSNNKVYPITKYDIIKKIEE